MILCYSASEHERFEDMKIFCVVFLCCAHLITDFFQVYNRSVQPGLRQPDRGIETSLDGKREPSPGTRRESLISGGGERRGAQEGPSGTGYSPSHGWGRHLSNKTSRSQKLLCSNALSAVTNSSLRTIKPKKQHSQTRARQTQFKIFELFNINNNKLIWSSRKVQGHWRTSLNP